MSQNKLTSIVGNSKSFAKGSMHMVDIADAETKVLLVHGYDGKFYSLGGKCSHYKGLLASGVLGHERVRCPLHGACFRLNSGEIEDYPGVDCIRKYETFVDPSGDVIVKGTAAEFQEQIVAPPVALKQEESSEHVVIIGGGPAGLVCSETLRQNGFKGKLTLLSSEPHLPIDRPKLSKKPSASIAELLLRPEAFFEQNLIKVELNTAAKSLDPVSKTITDESGRTFKYDKLVICTGSKARTLADEPAGGNLHYLRSQNDASNISRNIIDKDVVVIGSSFIGMELASSSVKTAKSLTVVSATAAPFEAVFGREIGTAIMEWYKKQGVKFVVNAKTEKFNRDSNSLVKSISLSNGETLSGEEFICGIGTLNSTNWLKSSGIKLCDRTFSIEVDEYMKTNLPDIYAAGDCVKFPLKLFNTHSSILHWQMAHHLGRIAGFNVAGKEKSVGNIVPFFWTANFNKSLRFAGVTKGAKNMHVIGDIDGLKFAAYYLDEKNLVNGVATFGMDPVAARFAELMSTGQVWIDKCMLEKDPKLEDLANTTFAKLASSV